MFLVDLAVPRDIESEVNELGDAYLYTVDDLQHENILIDKTSADLLKGSQIDYVSE